MASGEALGSYSSALVLSDVAAIHVNGNNATTRNRASGSHSPKSRFCQVSSPTIALVPATHVQGEQHEQTSQDGHHAERDGGAEPHLACSHADAVGVGRHQVRRVGGAAAGEHVHE